MRLAGFVLVLLGFFWIAVDCALAGTAAAARSAYHYDKVRSAPTITEKLVRYELGSMSMDAARRRRSTIIPASIMLVGALLLDRASRRTRGNVVKEHA